MSAPTVVSICRCGHPQRLHSDEYGCDRTECGCTSYREGPTTPVAEPSPAARPVAHPPVRPVAPAPQTARAVEQLIAAGKRSPSKRTQTLAERIEAQAIDLRERLLAERAAAEERRRAEAAKQERRREVERLERELREAKDRLNGRTPPAAKSAVGQLTCTRDGCGRDFATSQARALHERRAHDGFDPRAAG